jgi:hypothetical protein
MTKPTAGEIERALKKGQRFRLRASDYSKSEFRWMAKAAGVGGGQLTIYEAGTLSEWDRKDISEEAPDNVEYEV